MIFSLVLASFFITSSEQAPGTISQLDSDILRKRLQRMYGEFGHAWKSKWEAASGGKTEVWQWDGRKLVCPNSELNCSDWTPKALLWFRSKVNWMEPWIDLQKEGFVLDPQNKQKQSKALSAELVERIVGSDGLGSLNATGTEANENEESEFSEFAPDEDQAEELEPVRFNGKRMALEKWRWTNAEGRSIRVYTTLREESWIERIDYDNTVEYIDWDRKNKWSTPDLQKVVLERGGERLTLTYMAPPKKSKN